MTEKTQRSLIQSVLTAIETLSLIGRPINRGLTLYKARLIQRVLRITINNLKSVDAVISDYINSEVTAAEKREIPENVIVSAIQNLTQEYAAANAGETQKI